MLINEIEKLRTNRASQKRTLANFILQNKQDVYRMTLDELSAQSTVSVSTILRTVHSLGFQSYGDFREAFYDSLRVLNKTDEWLSWCEHLKPQELIVKMIEGEQSELETLKAVDPRKIESIVDQLIACRKVFVLGQHASAAMASLLSYELGKVRQDVFMVSRFDQNTYQQLSSANEHDIVIVFAFPRYPKNILKAARYLRNKGCFIVCIGHSDDSVFSEIADVFLEIYLNYYGFTTGYSSIMTALNFMVLRYCQRNAENVKRCIENFETVMSENDVFVTK